MRDASSRDPSPAEAYESYMVPGMFAPFVADLLAAALPQPGEHVLDLACGTGVVVRQLAPLVMPGGSVDALDINAAMLSVARDVSRSAGAQCSFYQGNMEMLPFAARTYDLVTCQQGLQFVGDRAAAVSEMRRVLRDGGRAVVSCWSAIEHHPLSLAIVSLMERYSGASNAQAAFALSSPDELQILFESAGFAVVTISTVTRPVRFAEPDRYVAMAVSGVIAANPELQQMPNDERIAMIASLRAEAEPILRHFVLDNEVVSTKQTRIVHARA